jgi:hypothetical protein
MPTFAWYPRFGREYLALSRRESATFRRARDRFIAALQAKRPLEAGLGIREMSGHPGVYEFRFSAGGRATFHYGKPVIPGEAHVIWRRIGGHEIYQEP